jgi:GT2 family glycosyltransferase
MAVTVSIITPCYNGAPFLADTLRSALNQTRPPIEIIMIDDGSTDDSAAIAESFGPPVRVIRQENQGESVARNRGIAEARGTYILFLDADDLLAPEALARLADVVAQGPGTVAIMGCAWFRDDPDTPYSRQAMEHRAFYPGIIEANFGPPHCWLTPREVIQAAGGFCETMRWFEDWDLWWRVGLEASALVPAEGYVGAFYRQHAKSQLATTRPADRALGHATLVGRMTETILRRPAVLQAHGERLFWSAWSAINHARDKGVAWSAIEPLTSGVAELARSGPDSVKSLPSARLTRAVGIRAAALAWRIWT